MGDTQNDLEFEATCQLFQGYADVDHPFGTWLEDETTFARLEILDSWTGHVIAWNNPMSTTNWTFGEDDTSFYAQLNYGVTGLSGSWWNDYGDRNDVAVMYKIYALQGHFEGGEEPPVWVTDHEMLTFAGDLKPPSSTWGPRLLVPRDRFVELRIPKIGGAQRPLAEWLLRMGVGAAWGIGARWRTWYVGSLTLELFRGDPLHGGTKPTGGGYVGYLFDELFPARRHDGIWIVPKEIMWPVPTADWGSISHIGMYDRPSTWPGTRTLLWVAPLDKVVRVSSGIKVIIPPGRLGWQVA